MSVSKLVYEEQVDMLTFALGAGAIENQVVREFVLLQNDLYISLSVVLPNSVILLPSLISVIRNGSHCAIGEGEGLIVLVMVGEVIDALCDGPMP